MPRRTRDAAALLGLLKTGSPSEIASALNALVGVSDSLDPAQREIVMRAATNALESTDPALRGQAMFALGQLGADPDALERGLSDPDWFVRLSAVNGLARAKPPLRLAAITALRDDPEPLVRSSVAAALADAGSTGSPMRHRTDQPTWREYWAQERALVREDLFRRSLGNNFAVLMAVFVIAVSAILLIAHAGLAEAAALSIAGAIGMAPAFWIRGWRTIERQRLYRGSFAFVETLLALGWAVLFIIFIGALSRAFGWR